MHKCPVCLSEVDGKDYKEIYISLYNIRNIESFRNLDMVSEVKKLRY